MRGKTKTIKNSLRVPLLGTVLFLVFFFLPKTANAACETAMFGGGAGTSGDPWQISTPAHLNNLRECLGSSHNDKYFKLTSDIDLDVSPYNTGSGWAPIGNSSSKFYGKFDGDYKKISNLFINRPGISHTALFGYLNSGGIIENIALEDVDVTGGNMTAGLLGANYGIVQNSYATGETTVESWSGGLVGSSYGTVRRCYSDVDVTILSGESVAGSLLGETWGSSATTYDCYARGDVHHISAGQGALGGLMGNDYNSNSKYNLYSTGQITTQSSFPNNTGGLIGTSYTSMTSSYWDTQTSGWDTSGLGTGKTTAQMKQQATYVGWDFDDTWAIDGTNNDGYPYLRWQDFTPVYTLTYSAGANGSITGSTSQSISEGSDGTAVTAVGDSGFHFVSWSDASTANPRTDTSVTQDISVTATFAPDDSDNPTVSSLSPGDGESGVEVSADLVIEFSETVDVKTGNITIKKSADDSVIETIDVTSDQVTGTGTDTITIDLSADFAQATGYYVLIDTTAFDDTAGNSFAGISEVTTWNFVTVNNDIEVTPPEIKIGSFKEELKSNKKSHSKEKKPKFKGEDASLSGGTVKVYKNGKKIDEISVGSDGKWDSKVKFKHDKTYEMKFKFFNDSGEQIGSNKYEIKVDTEDPIFESFPKNGSSHNRGEKVKFSATDNEKIKKYKVYFNGKVKTTKKQSFKIPKNTPAGTYSFRVKAYDKAGNKETEETNIQVR